MKTQLFVLLKSFSSCLCCYSHIQIVTNKEIKLEVKLIKLEVKGTGTLDP